MYNLKDLKQGDVLTIRVEVDGVINGLKKGDVRLKAGNEKFWINKKTLEEIIVKEK